MGKFGPGRRSSEDDWRANVELLERPILSAVVGTASDQVVHLCWPPIGCRVHVVGDCCDPEPLCHITVGQCSTFSINTERPVSEGYPLGDVWECGDELRYLPVLLLGDHGDTVVSTIVFITFEDSN